MRKKIIAIKKDSKKYRKPIQTEETNDIVGKFRLSVEVEGIKNLECYPIGGRSIVFDGTRLIAEYKAARFSEDSTIMHLVEEVLYNEDTDDTLLRNSRIFLVTVILSKITQGGVETISTRKKILHGGFTFADTY